MPYIGSITIDCLQSGGNAYEKLKAALIQLGWEWIETSSFAISDASSDDVLRALELIAKASASIGGFSHVSYQIQWVDPDIEPRIPSSFANHPNALDQIRGYPFP